MRLEVHGLDQFTAAINDWVDSVEDLTVKVARGLSVEIFHKAVEGSPVYSGDFMANWMYKVGSPDPSFQPLSSVPYGRHEAGHIERFGASTDLGMIPNSEFGQIARLTNIGRELAVTELGPTIYISNSAEHDQQYAWMIENNTIRWRPENESAGRIASKTVLAVANVYKHIGRAEAAYLSNRVIGA